MKQSSPGRSHYFSLATLFIGTLFLGLRSSLGFDLRDGSYVTALTMRAAHGDVAFIDELSPHIFGAYLAVPAMWLWLDTFGHTGVLLLSRLLYVALAATCAIISWWALKPSLGKNISAIAVATATLAIPYNILNVSYNTAPQLSMMVAFAAAIATLRGRHLAWAAVCSTACVVASISFFALLPAAAVLITMIFVFATDTGTEEKLPSLSKFAGALLVPAFVIGSCFIAWITLIPGWPQVAFAWSALDAAADGRRGIGMGAFYWHFVAGARLLPLAMLLATVAATLSALKWRIALLILTFIALAAWAGEFGDAGQEPTGGKYAGATALAMLVVLSPALITWSVRNKRAHRKLWGLTLPSAVVALISIGSTTMSGASYGAYASAMSGALIATVAVVADMICFDRKSTRFSSIVNLGVLALLPSVFAASLLAVVFDEGTVLHVSNLVKSGPAAGLIVSDRSVQDIHALEYLSQACPADDVWAVGVPAIHVWVGGHSDVPQYWVAPHDAGSALKAAQEMGKQPACVLVPEELSLLEGSEEISRLLRTEYFPRGRSELLAKESGVLFTMYVLKGPDNQSLSVDPGSL